ncbi:hypothetical protein SAMN05444746_1433 [Variovorax sp. OK212]|nr:hypothetical protein SAMN05518853_1453 [Variovorax sp. OK202]SFE80780.1 hypothetical protein SAMN05444746_1433 [Variovorax sp. OK212]
MTLVKGVNAVRAMNQPNPSERLSELQSFRKYGIAVFLPIQQIESGVDGSLRAPSGLLQTIEGLSIEIEFFHVVILFLLRKIGRVVGADLAQRNEHVFDVSQDMKNLPPQFAIRCSRRSFKPSGSKRKKSGYLFLRFSKLKLATRATSSSESTRNFLSKSSGTFLFAAICCLTAASESLARRLNNELDSFLFIATNSLTLASYTHRSSRISSGTVLLCATHFR